MGNGSGSSLYVKGILQHDLHNRPIEPLAQTPRWALGNNASLLADGSGDFYLKSNFSAKFTGSVEHASVSEPGDSSKATSVGYCGDGITSSERHGA